MTTKTKKRGSSKWKPFFLVEIYRAKRAGVLDQDLIKLLGVSKMTWTRWKSEIPEVKQVLGLVEKEESEGETLPEWIYAHLRPELKEVWDKILRWEGKKGGVEKIELMLRDAGKVVRQQIFLHALVHCHWNPSAAMQKTHITKAELDRWVREDVGFAELVDEIRWHKGNFFEGVLAQLVADGVPAAVIFANKTYNATRGYATRTEVDVNVSGSVLHGVVDLSEVMDRLSQECRLELLKAIREREEEEKLRSRAKSLTPEDAIGSKIAHLGCKPEEILP